MAPGPPTVQLYRRLPATGVRAADDGGPAGHRRAALVPHLAAQRHARSNEVRVWVVNEPEDLQHVLDLGVAEVITNRPGPVMERLGRRQPSS